MQATIKPMKKRSARRSVSIRVPYFDPAPAARPFGRVRDLRQLLGNREMAPRAPVSVEHARFDRSNLPGVVDFVNVVACANGIARMIECGAAGAYEIELPCCGGPLAVFPEVQVSEEDKPASELAQDVAESARVRQPASKLFDPEPRLRGWVVNEHDRRAAGDLGVREDTNESVELPPPEPAG